MGAPLQPPTQVDINLDMLAAAKSTEDLIKLKRDEIVKNRRQTYDESIFLKTL
jgi:hypothetical protein